MSRKILMQYIVPIVRQLFPTVEIDDRLLRYLDREITFSFGVIGGWKHCDDLEAKILVAFAKENPAQFRAFIKKLMDDFFEKNTQRFNACTSDPEEFPDRLKDARKKGDEVFVVL
ncbi:MAG: hypothetical protein NWE83_04650 [Candidatus Bathyarchaeota archaeon]|nr:hypothetical protein [Candidatus Bathyarchaeota archaeon]